MSLDRLVCTFIFVASQYSPGVMAEVVQNRLAMGHLQEPLPRVDGYVAMRDCERIGEVVWLAPVGYHKWESFLVVDCAMPEGTDGAAEWMTENDILVEVGHETALRWDAVGRGVKIRLKDDRPRLTR